MEEKVRKQLELEKIQENSQYIQNILNRREVEIDEIDLETKERNLESVELL